MSQNVEEHTVDAWIALFRAKEHVLSNVEKVFKQNGLPLFLWYDVLWELDKAGSKGLRPFEIEQGMLIPQYGMSRLLARMEKAGYIVRSPSSVDGRGHLVSITQSGSQTRQKMWQVYSQEIQSSVGDKLTEEECHSLRSILAKLFERSVTEVETK
ncbi:helix-turn-helix domain-containing protein [Pseudoalteromonas sp. MMG005]|uniref:MarR family winged helix-turn-helix transcriptional regulator n=1 Tax=Pseudoalteromonas sp. MMG005 TaxID=2822682 RepID=UPI001B3A75CF|nr:helix-turn-helix domain-containing protein [Pseudoalteromonas sp. MMG005]MBQ4845227.1 winged helix-turn-helix transcriptional regulator [Pseudoalteromonas sp. MMG005]